MLLACVTTPNYAYEEGFRCAEGGGVFSPPEDLTLSVSHPSDAETVFEACLWDVSVTGCDGLNNFYAIAYPLDGWPYGVFTAAVSYHGHETFTTTCSVTGSTDDGAGVVTAGEVATFSVTIEE